MQFTPNNKLASLGTIGLLFLAGIAGMVFLLPYNTAHAASPTVVLSTITGLSSQVGGPTELTGVTSGTVGSSLTITGQGFSGNAPIAISSTSGTGTVSWFITNTLTGVAPNTCTSTFATNIGGIGTANSLYTGAGATACLTTSATGMFKVTTVVPALPGGPETIVVSDGTNAVSTSFSITPSVSFAKSGTNFGYPEQPITGTITVTGFGSGESVAIATTAFTTTSLSCTTGTSLTGGASTNWGANALVIGTSAGTCSAAVGGAVADTTGGAKSITATGATSTLTASTTFTVKPWVAFYNSATSPTTFSFIGTAPTSLLIEGHGFAATTIAASSTTIGGVATNHASVTPGTSGAFTGLVVSPTSNVPFGLVSVVIGGTTFSYAAGNIALGTLGWGGALISSIQGTASSTGVANTDAASYKPGGVAPSTSSSAPLQNQIGFFGYGFCVPTACSAGTSSVAIATPSGATICNPDATTCTTGGYTFNVGNGGGTNNVDVNGAFFAFTYLGETPWSAAATPTTAASYTWTVTQSTHGPANVLSPSTGITPYIKIGSSTIDFTTSNQVFTGHGFSANDVLTVTIGGLSMLTGGTCTATNGNCATPSSKAPDLAAGPQNVVITGSLSGQSVTSTGGVTYDPAIIASGSATALSLATGSGGTAIILRTQAAYGVHGLYASTAYSIVWNGLSGVVIGTFTSTATGGIPVPGVQVTIPADSSGIHIIDIQRTATTPTSFLYANNIQGDYSDSDSGLGATYGTNFGDMLFNLKGGLSASPSVAMVGSPESLSGSGLTAGTTYYVAVSSSSGTVPTNAPALATFTTTSTGSVPSGVTVTLTDTPTTLETGTLQYFQVQTAAHFGVSTVPDATAQFVLAASANLNATSEPAGHAVTITAHALNPGAVYNIIFNYVQSAFSSTSYTGTPVGVIAPNSLGAGSASFNVPSGAASGATVIQLVVSSAGTGGAATGTAVLDTPLSLNVGGVSGTCTNQGTACMSITGTPAVSKSGGNTVINAAYTNNSNAPQTAYIYGVVHNALGQTVYYTTASVNPAAGATQTGQLVLFGLPSGTYSVSIFVVSPSGTALSTTSTVSVTI